MALVAMSSAICSGSRFCKVVDGRMTMVSAAHVLGLSTRQVRRLLERIRTAGAASIRHQAIGRPSNNRISDADAVALLTIGKCVYVFRGAGALSEGAWCSGRFRVAKKDAKGGHGMTQFGRALCELNIKILCANSSQAKGRVERMNRTLQDRLIEDLRLEGVCGMDDGNAFLPRFMERYNRQFAITPAPDPMICIGR